MLALDRKKGAFLYQQVIDLITDKIDSSTLRAGDRLPSLRQLSQQFSVSIPTVKQAYLELERQGRVVSRPQSGFYVRAAQRKPIVRTASGVSENCCSVERRDLIERVYAEMHQPDVVPFGIANACMAKPAAKALHRTMKRVMARAEERSLSYAPPNGELSLRRQIAHRYLEQGGDVDPESIVITNGGQEALALALTTVTSPGDIVAVESPTYQGALELIESLGLLAVEIETCPRDGLELGALATALKRHRIKACLFSSALNNPLGSRTSDAHRRELVALLEKHEVPLIEDDVYGDLCFDGVRPKPAQHYSRKGQVLTCGSFSKTAAPGYRIGWLVAGNQTEAVKRLKRALSCSSGLLQQLTLADFVATGDYDRYLKTLRPVLRRNAERMSAIVARHFPAETRMSDPVGGSVLWLELPHRVDSGVLFYDAIGSGVSIAPGLIFSPGVAYRNFIRLSFGHQWSSAFENGLVTLAGLVKQRV